MFCSSAIDPENQMIRTNKPSDEEVNITVW